MLGAILGDIIGSRFEFYRDGKTKDFNLFTRFNDFTDDTVMTVAIADALIDKAEIMEDVFKYHFIKSMQKWGRKYPNAGYGQRFYWWLKEEEPKPYGSYGNGSAMRVSSIGWLFDELERVRRIARWSAEVSHNHIEGIKGAECTAAVIYLARTGHSKEEIKDYVIKEFNYDLTESLDELRKRHEHIESCMDSLPKALVSFFEGDSYEDVVRNAVSIGGDTDTLAAIAGAMAEAMYGIPESIKEEGLKYLPNDMKEVIDRFNRRITHVM